MRRLLESCCLAALFLSAGFPVLAQLPVARLLTIFPPGGKAGSRFEARLTGFDLDEAGRIYFEPGGITAELRPEESGDSQESKTFFINIATNVPPGVYEARVAGRFGVSNPRAFVVGDLPESLASTTNDAPANASALSLETTVNGSCAAGAARYFKFAAKARQRILITCQAKEIDSRLDPALVLFDAAGKELERSRREGLLDFTAPADGQYILKLHDSTYRGGEEYFFRLTAGTGPHLDFIFPPSGLLGAKGKYLLYGRNLPGGIVVKDLTVDGKPLEQLEVEIELPQDSASRPRFSPAAKPAELAVDTFEYRLDTTNGVSNPVRISFATGPVVTAQPPGILEDRARQLSPPCEWAGRFQPRGGWNRAVFEAKKGDVYRVEVFSQRLGLGTDPVVVIQHVTKNEQGQERVSDVQELYGSEANAGGAEYNTATRDPMGRFEAAESGTYRIQVRDLFNRAQTDARAVFRLALRRETPDFRLLVAAEPPPPPNKDTKEALLWTPFLRRGESQPIKVIALRRDQFDGEIHLSIQGLPAGVSASDGIIEKDKNSASIMLTAGGDAAGWVGPIKVLGKASIGGTDLVREARGGTVTWTVSDYSTEAIQSRLTGGLVLAVSGVESTPISVETGEDKTWEAPELGKLKIPLRVIRRGEFNANLKLKAAGLAALDKLKEIEVEGKATNAVIELDLAENKISPGAHTFHLETRTTGKYRRNPEAAKAAEEAVQQAEKLVVDLTLAIKTTEEARQAAVKTVANFETLAKTEASELAEAAQGAKEAAELAKIAAEKLAAANSALAAKPDDQDLLATKQAAATVAEAAAVKSQNLLEAKSKAQAHAAEAAARAKWRATALRAAEALAAETPARLKAAEQKRDLARNRAKETAKTAEPGDETVMVYSAPIKLKVIATQKTAAQ